MSSLKRVLAFDYGASSGRAILGEYDGSRVNLSELHRFKNEPVHAGSHMYWDILRLFHELKQGLMVAAKQKIDIGSIGIDTWGVDFGLLDKNGLLISNPFHYRDSMTDDAMDEVFNIVSKEELYDQTGTQLLKFNTVFQLYAISKRYSQMLENADKLLMTPDLLNYFMTGEKASEFTIASTTQMLNWNTFDWHSELLKKIGIDTSFLCEIKKPGKLLGKIHPSIVDETGLDTKVSMICSHDTASAILAIPMEENEESAYISCGTWSLLGLELKQPIINRHALSINYTNEGGFDSSVRFLTNIMGLWIYQGIKSEFDRAEGVVAYHILDEEIMRAEPFAAFIDPDDARFMPPGHMIQKITDFCMETGQKPPESRGAILRCVLESLALKYHYALIGLEDMLGRRLKLLRIVGGGSKDKLLMQFAASATGKPVYAGPAEATALGNICAQLIALGEAHTSWEARDIIKSSFDPEIYLPDEQNAWKDAYSRFSVLLNNRHI